MEEFPFEKVVFNSDMLNDEDHIYFDMYRVTQGFGFIKYPIEGDIKDSIQKWCHKLYAYGSIPSYVLIPIKHYHEIISKETLEMVENGMTFRTWLDMLGLQLYIMTPDYLKENIII